MPRVCVHNIPETLKGVGPCSISFEVKKRNGKPNWWCHTHGMDAAAPDGAALPACPGAWFDPVPPERQREIDITEGEVAVWGAVPPAICIGEVPIEPGKVHVHHRASGSTEKDIDESFDIVRLTNGDCELVVENMAAVAFSVSQLSGQRVVALRCPKEACGGMHIDELKFATQPHVKHLCNQCGRNFRDASGASISNPLADAATILDIQPPRSPERADRTLDLDREAYAAIALWPSNPAIISTMSRTEEIGIHVHAWDAGGTRLIDDTYGEVTLDNQLVDEVALRGLAVQRAVVHDAPIIAKSCENCGSALLSPSSGWIEPSTTHVCGACGDVTKTRRRVFINPLTDK